MYAWYRESSVCYAYLSDVPGDADLRLSPDEFRRSRWWTRGWTLQELLTPCNVVFFFNEDGTSQDQTPGKPRPTLRPVQHLPLLEVADLDTYSPAKWRPLGRKAELGHLIKSITNIDDDVLNDPKSLETMSIAQRMSWASNRKTSRPEDMAYCLMGLFDVHMPMLYGEGAERAFLRLQEEIMKSSDDRSLFAWKNEVASPDARFGLLATSPRFFRDSSLIMPYDDWQARPPYQMTNHGLQIGLPLIVQAGRYWAALDCPMPPENRNFSQLAICLEKLPGSEVQFARVRVGEFHELSEEASGLKEIRHIYVRQQQKESSAPHLLPRHELQFRSVMCGGGDYQVVDVFTKYAAESSGTEITMNSIPAFVLPEWKSIYYTASKSPWTEVAVAVLLERKEDGERLLVRIGSTKCTRVGFDAIQQSSSCRAGSEDHEQIRRHIGLDFVPRQSGSVVQLKHHQVRVNFSEPEVYRTQRATLKLIFVDLDIIGRSPAGWHSVLASNPIV